MRTDGSCAMKSWGMAAVLGALAFLLLLGGKGVVTALFLGALAFILLGLLFSWLFCAPLPDSKAAAGTPSSADSAATAAADATSSAQVAGAGVTGAAGAAVAGAAVADVSTTAEPQSDASAASGSGDASGSAPAEETAGSAEETSGAGPDTGTSGQSDSPVKPSAKLAGQEELASRKGEWKYEADAAGSREGATSAGNDTAAAEDTGTSDAQSVAADSTQATETTSGRAADDAAGGAAAGAVADAEAGAKVKPSTRLAGQEDLASRKGSWTYSKDGAPAGAASASASASHDAGRAERAGVPPVGSGVTEGADADVADVDGSITKSEAEAAEAAGVPPVGAGVADGDAVDVADVDGSITKAEAQGAEAAGVPPVGSGVAPSGEMGDDFDRDGVNEGTEEGSKPELLDGPRNGQPDNLKEIKGIGPKLEKLCHSIGVYHFDQIAVWTDEEVAWVNANLVGFKGRVSRDNWVEQAKILASGEETEFSQRVGKGGVYD